MVESVVPAAQLSERKVFITLAGKLKSHAQKRSQQEICLLHRGLQVFSFLDSTAEKSLPTAELLAQQVMIFSYFGVMFTLIFCVNMNSLPDNVSRVPLSLRLIRMSLSGQSHLIERQCPRQNETF